MHSSTARQITESRAFAAVSMWQRIEALRGMRDGEDRWSRLMSQVMV